MNPFRLLFSFRGRIGRPAFLFGLVLLSMMLVGGLWGTSSEVLLPRLVPSLAPLGVNAAFVQTGLWVLLSAFCLWMFLALTVKRLHDRGRWGGWALIAFVPMAAMLVLETTNFAIRPLVTLPEPAHFAIWGISLLVATWVAIECVMLRGARFELDDLDAEEGGGRRGDPS